MPPVPPSGTQSHDRQARLSRSMVPRPPARAPWPAAWPSTLGLPYLDTGLLYRAVGRRVLDQGGDPGDAVSAEAAARALAPADLERGDLRGPEADAAAAAVASIAAVRIGFARISA